MANNTAQGKTLEKKGFKLPISGNALVLLIALVLVTAIFSALNPNYFTYGNFINILVSSTLIRSLLKNGQRERALRLLGRRAEG